MYDTILRSLYRPHMANYVYVLVDKCQSCRQHRGNSAHQRKLKLFPAEGPLYFFSIDILGPLPKTKRVNQHIIVNTDRYRKLSRAIPISTITAPAVAMVLLNYWIIPYRIPTSPLSYYGPKISSKFFSALCSFLFTDLRTTRSYHAQSNVQTKRYNQKIFSRLSNFV